MLSSIRIFLKVVEVGSFSKAAAVLNMAPSSIARSIDNLEKQLGVTLFERSTRALRLTERGGEYCSGAQKLIDDYDQLCSGLSDTSVAKGKLRVSVFESFGRVVVCPVLGEFLQRYPEIELEVELENQVVDLYQSDVDIAIRVGQPVDSRLKARVLTPMKTVVCAAPEYLTRHGVPDEPAELAQHNCLVMNRGRQQTFWHFSRRRQQKKVLVNGNLQSRGGTPLLAAALTGGGIVQLSNWMVAGHIRRGELIPVLTDWTPSLREQTDGSVYVLYKQTHYPNPLVRLFIDYLIEKIHVADD
ncbi:LysR family transcriptional regulator [Vibrio mangrovi]|uniref:HTH-type transcriptional regulator DmlR n=1 Tax=Vibrio mangrovi TaxID=474394 RepID=A0A1Y6IST3_9VIBR|nr:LysR family transcriptional regulator [Vibrio mangrovi]MDW6001294.1 LysR family transcriptional regulator [Vibrio mangrovi]SMS00686.1 HTH-type transcriptional regulator DmlR [Vibrio mangrovi]